MIIDELIFDRAYADLLTARDINGKDWDSLTEEQQAAWAGYTLKGAYAHADMNRVGEAVSYLAGRFTVLPAEFAAYRESVGVASDPFYEVPYDAEAVTVSPKTDWTAADIPRQEEAATYLDNVSHLRGVIALPGDAPAVPASLDHLGYAAANDIERILYTVDTATKALEADTYDKMDRTVDAFVYCGTVYSGE